jgi:hypothetical protein
MIRKQENLTVRGAARQSSDEPRVPKLSGPRNFQKIEKMN